MRIHRLLIVLLCWSAIVDLAAASNCERSDNRVPQNELSTSSFPSLAQKITVCDLRNEFNANNSPRMYWVLHKGLYQPDDAKILVEESLTLASDAFTSGDWGRAEKIYNIVLTRFPKEPRILSSYAALHISRQQYKKASNLLDRALEIDPRDPLIVHNRFLVSILDGDYIKASKLNKQLMSIEPGSYQHLMRRALLDRFFINSGNQRSWQAFLNSLDNDNNRQYWKGFNDNFKRQNMQELVHIADQWIDYDMAYDAIMLLDYVVSKKHLADAWYIKAKALESKRHYKLAFNAANHARDILLSSQKYDETFYGNLLYEVGRLAYAVKNYEYSLSRYDEYRKNGYSHPHLDYMFAVNYDALGHHVKALPYFRKCIKQELPRNMRKYCEQRVKNSNQSTQAVSRAVDPKVEKPRSIKVGTGNIDPSYFLEGTVEKLQINWIGRVVHTEMKEENNSIHIVWVAKYLRPEKPIEVIDGNEYTIKFKKDVADQIFQIDIYLEKASDTNKEDIKKNFLSDDKYVLVSGQAYDIRPFHNSLATVVSARHAIFTSKIAEIY